MASKTPKPWVKLYHTRRWEKRSRLNLEMHKHLCQECLRNGKVEPATISHHVNEYRESFSELDFWYGELTALCTRCHFDTHGYNKPKDYQADIGIDGYALDPNHPMNRFESLSYEERMAITKLAELACPTERKQGER